MAADFRGRQSLTYQAKNVFGDAAKNMSNQNAHIGMDVERLFKNSIKSKTHVIETLKEHFEIEGDFATAYSTGTDAGKSDVILKFADGKTLSANIKAFKAGFNQITRAKIPAFCSRFGIENLTSMFEDAAVRVASKSGRFILETDENRVLEVLSPLAKRILQVSIAGLEHPELLVLYARTANLMILYDLADLLENLDYQITFSKRGIIKFGQFFTIQRKGGNGVHSIHIPKTSLDHPGNGLQVKMNVRKFVNENEPLIKYKA